MQKKKEETICYLNFKDLRDLEKCPVPGLGIICPDESNPFLLHCNVCINDLRR